MKLDKKIKSLLDILSNNDKMKILRHFNKLISQFIGTSGLNKSICIFMDNNIIQDTKYVHDGRKTDNKIRIIRFISTYLFFDFIKKFTNFDVKLAISPVIFYELSGRKKLSDKNEYEKQVKNIFHILSIFNIKINFHKFNSYESLNYVLKKVIEDEKTILNEIKKINQKDWTIKLKEGNEELIPFFKSFDLIPKNIVLQYFQNFYVNFILASKIEKFILENKYNDKNIRTKYIQNTTEFPLSSLIKIKKGALSDLGDIELFQECDLSYQYELNSKNVLCAITFDETLNTILSKRQTPKASSEPIITGRDSKQNINNKLSNFFTEQQKIYDIAEKEKIFLI